MGLPARAPGQLAGRRASGRRAEIPLRAVLLVAVLACLALVVWTLWLGADLPSRYLVGHWDLAWVGFDLLLAGSIAATGKGELLRGCADAVAQGGEVAG